MERPYLDPSVRYRCYNFAEAFVAQGDIADVVSFAKLDLQSLQNYDVCVFHRPPYGEKLFRSLEILQKNHTPFFADYDDLIFNEKYALASSIYKQGRAGREECLRIFSDNEKALRLFDNVTVSTHPLREKVLEIRPEAEVTVVYNALPESVLRDIELHEYKKSACSGPKIISYLSGTASHNKDFEIVEDVLAELTRKHSGKAKLVIVGPLEFSKEKFENIVHKRHVEFDRLFGFISRTNINIAPLEMNDFTNCKSGLKFFESAVLGIPTVSTPIADMLRFKDSDGIDYATEPQEWFDALETLILDEEHYDRRSRNALWYSREHCLVSQSLKVFERRLGALL